MPKGKEEMMDWLYQFVKSFGEQGIAIQDLSDKFDIDFQEEVAENEHVKDEIWQAFMRRDGVKIEGSEEEVGVMQNLELGDTLALGYGVRKVVIRADSVDVVMVEASIEIPRSDEKELVRGASQSNDETVQSGISANFSKPLIPNASTPIVRSPEPKEQFIPISNGSSFTKIDPSFEPRSGTKKSYKIADDPRGTQGSQRRLQSLLDAARAEADGFHTPNIATPLQRSDGAKDVEITGNLLGETTNISKVDHQSQLHLHHLTATTNSQTPRPGPSDQSAEKSASINGQRRNEMDMDIPNPQQVHLSTTGPSTPKAGYQYQPAPSNNTRLDGAHVEDAQPSTSPTENDAGGIDYFAPKITRHGPVPGQRKRGRQNGSGRQPTPGRQVERAISAMDHASMSFSSLAEVEQFESPKLPPKKRGRPIGSTVKHKAPINESRPDKNSEDTANTGLFITESGLRSSRRQPKPRQIFTPTQVASPEPEPTTTRFRKSSVSTTPSKPPRRHREPIYTSYEDLLREEDDQKRKAGIDGVYINPLDAREGRSLARKKIFVVVVKSQKLRDPDLLESRKGTWIEVLAEKRKALHAMVEAEAAKIAATAAAAAEEEKPKKRKRGEHSEAKSSKRPKPLDSSLENSSDVSTTEPTKSLEVLSAGIIKSSEVPSAVPEKPLKVMAAEPTNSSELSSTKISKSQEASSAGSPKESEVLSVRRANLQEALNTGIQKQPRFPTVENTKPLEVSVVDSAVVSDVPNSGTATSSAFPRVDPAEYSMNTGPKSDHFPSNEELALEFEKFKAQSAAKTSANSSTNTDSFPSNEELAMEFEKFKAGFIQQPSQNLTPEPPGLSQSTVDPFVANSMQYGQQAAWIYPRAHASIPNPRIPGSSPFFSADYMNQMRPRSPQPHFSHPVSHYGFQSHITKPHTTSFQVEGYSAAIPQPQQPRWNGPLAQPQASANVHNYLPPVLNTISYRSPYREQSEYNQIAGRQYQPPYHGHVPVIQAPSPEDKYRSYGFEEQATPSILALNPWLARNPAHIHSPVYQSPVHQSPVHQSPVHQSPVHQSPVHQSPVHQIPVHPSSAKKSWPAGFLPPEPPKPQNPLNNEWPAGFLPPAALESDTAPSSPMTIDSHRQLSPASLSHASDPSTVAHTSQENVSSRPTPYASPQQSHSDLLQPQSASSGPDKPSPYSRPAIPTMNPQPQVGMGRQNGLGQVQVSSPLNQQFNPTESVSLTPDVTPADNYANIPRSEIGEKIQASKCLAQVPPSPTQSSVLPKSAKEGQPEHVYPQIHLPKAVESQLDQNSSKVYTPAPENRSSPVRITPEPIPEPAPETKKRKRSVSDAQLTPSPKISAAISAKLPESSNITVEANKKIPPAAIPDDIEGFEKAEAMQFEPFFARMSSIYNSVMGNLILSFDKTELKFWSMAEEETDPIWTMQVGKMAENPIVSMPGSNPMELRLKEKKDDESIAVHRFLIARTKEASKSANEMRANLVTARIFVQMANPQIVHAEDPEVIATKPWKCEKCGARFKNREGIKYHLSKSQTTCNPNFKPKSVKQRQHGRSKETSKEENVTNLDNKAIDSLAKKVQPELTDEPESESEGGDSDDSIFEWAAKVAALKKSPKKNRGDRGDRGDSVIGRSGKIYKSLGGERPALLKILETVKQTPSLMEELAKIPSLPQNPDQPLPETLLPISKEKIVKDLILCLLRANNNTLPGERGLWFAFVACWLKYYPTSKILPESKLFSRALDELLEDGILSKITFDFPGARSRTITRSILFDPKAIAPSSSDIEKLKGDTKLKHPDFYIPSEFSPPNVILEILIAIGKPAPLAPAMSATQLNDILGSDEEAGMGDSSDDEFKPEIHALEADDDLEDDLMDLDMDSDGAGSEFSPFPDCVLPQALQLPSLNQQNPLKINGSQKIKPRMRYPAQAPTPEERERRKRTTGRKEERWTSAPTILQNLTNGAWDVSSKPKRTYKLRERLTEPITFMQDPSGSWSVRPFGHGVNPIFARPNKITTGNPQGEHYLQQREDGHRPVIHPKKPVMRPSVPSKIFLNKNIQGDLVTRPDGQIEISQNTGLPKRHYTYRTRSQKDPEISRHTGIKKRGYKSLTPDPMELMEANVNGMTELDILNHYEAKPLEEELGRQINPGLASIPSTPATPGLSHLFLNESAGLWDLAHPFVACTNVEKLKLQWLDRTAFTLETIPYSALEDNDDLTPEQQTLIGPKRRRQQKKVPHIGVRKGLKNKWVMARRLTSAPDDLLGLHRDVRYAAELLGTQMVNYDTNIRRKRQRFKEQGLATDEEERLTMGIVIIRTMLGGLEMNIDWVILGSVFKDYSLNFLKKWWQVVWAKKKSTVDKLTQDFQAVFIVGYRKGQVQSIDYDHIIDYDFNTLIDWSLSKINTPTVEKKVFDLPNSFSELKDRYALVPEPRSNYWSEQYYYPLAAIYQRMNLVNSVPFTVPLEQEAPTNEIDDYALAKSWCRAAAVTPDHLWDSKAANKLLNRLPSSVIIKAREDLLNNKIITQNKRLRTNGRVYNIPDAFNAIFVRTGKIIYEKQYQEAYDFKCELDQRFRNGETTVNIPWGVNEGSVLAITNLQANGLIQVLKSNIRANKFGLTEGGYETRLIDKAKYRFQMDITPTSSYIYNHAIPNLDVISEPPSLGPRGAIPVWRSITGEVIESMWKKVLLGVTGAFVLRSSIDIEGLEKVFAPSLDAWEIKQLIEWGVERGVWQKCDYEGLGATAREASEMEGWEVGDWWWMIVGRYLAGGGI